nr:hypothetical protein Iba_chr13cCG13020 [Ipomoea batatas]
MLVGHKFRKTNVSLSRRDLPLLVWIRRQRKKIGIEDWLSHWWSCIWFHSMLLFVCVP